MFQNKIIVKISLCLIIVCLLLYFGAITYIGASARYLADDYCTANVFLTQGLIDSQIFWYYHWSGRYTFYLAVSLAEIGGIELVPFLPGVALLIWWVGLSWSVWQFNLVIKLPHAGLIAILLAGIILYATLDGNTDLPQSLYWRTGMLTYIAPLICLSIYSGLIIFYIRTRQISTVMWPWLILSFCFTFITAGFSETYAAAQITLLLLTLVGTFIFGSLSFRQTLALILNAGLLGAVLGLLVVALAPGNAVRQAFFPSPDILSLVPLTLQNTFSFIAEAVASPLPILMSLALPAILVSNAPARELDSVQIKNQVVPFFLFLSIVGFLLLLSCFAPAAYAMSSNLPNRAIIIPQFFLISILVSWSVIIGLCLRKMTFMQQINKNPLSIVFAMILVSGLLVFGPLLSARNTLELAQPAAFLAYTWDTRHEYIQIQKNAGVTELQVPSLLYSAELEDIGSDPQHWVNSCVAQYYGIQSVVAK